MEQAKHYVIRDNFKCYDFEKTMTFLNKFGKSKFGEKFQIQRSDSKILYHLATYAIRDEEFCEKNNIDLNKGILLIGKIGCGKTSLMDIFRILYYRKFHYNIFSAREISKEFSLKGFETIDKYGKMKRPICFDDLGIEQNLKHFGSECNIMAEILLSRYDLMKYEGIITHATTNLNADELEKIYGNRVRSRLREMFNVISFPSDVPDKRK
jgi:DNA replication protein DnaC